MSEDKKSARQGFNFGGGVKIGKPDGEDEGCCGVPERCDQTDPSFGRCMHYERYLERKKERDRADDFDIGL